MFKERLESERQTLSALPWNEIFVLALAHTAFNTQTWGARRCLLSYLSLFLSLSLFLILLTPPGADQRWLYENVLKVVTELREIKDGPMRNGSRHTGYLQRRRGLASWRNGWWNIKQRQTLCWENTMSCLIRLTGNLEAPDFWGFCFWLLLPNQSASQTTSVSPAKTVPVATTHSLCNQIKQMDRSVKHLKIMNLTCIVFSPSLSVWRPLVVSQCQFDSPVLLWTDCDNGALPAICNPPFDSLLWIMHCNHSLTNLLGMPIYKTPEWKSQNADCNIGLADSTTVICWQGLSFFSGLSASLLRLKGLITDGNEGKIIQMQEKTAINKKNKLNFWRKLSWPGGLTDFGLSWMLKFTVEQ